MPRFLSENARSIVTPETSAETVGWIAGMGLQAASKALFDLNHAITETDQRAEVSRVTLPTLIIHGSEDKSAPLALTGRELAVMIPGSELRVYDGAPHCLLVTHQSRLNADLESWVRT
ncbi:MAG: alpha/beta fold hydrolase [Gemmatimonadaceae bacterium]